MDGHVILRVICHVDENSIAFSSIDRWAGIQSVYSNDWLGMAQPAHILHLNLKNEEFENKEKKKRVLR